MSIGIKFFLVFVLLIVIADKFDSARTRMSDVAEVARDIE